MTITRKTRTGINAVSGAQTFTKQTINVSKAILLPQSEARKFVYDLSFLAGAGVAFTQGGLFEASDTFLLIDGKDLGTFKPTAGDFYTITGKTDTFECAAAKSFGNDEGWSVFLKSVKGVVNVL